MNDAVRDEERVKRGAPRAQACRRDQIGGNDFEEARIDIEQLSLLADPKALALHALERVQALVPSFAPNIATQIRGRLREHTVHLPGAGDLAGCVLRAFECLYTNGPANYFDAGHA